MKTILVLNKMPKSCMECPLRFKDGDTDDRFRFRCIKSKGQIPKEGRLWNCELKPLPHNDFIDEAEGYQTEEEYKAYVSGWNDCLDEILGGEE